MVAEHLRPGVSAARSGPPRQTGNPSRSPIWRCSGGPWAPTTAGGWWASLCSQGRFPSTRSGAWTDWTSAPGRSPAKQNQTVPLVFERISLLFDDHAWNSCVFWIKSFQIKTKCIMFRGFEEGFSLPAGFPVSYSGLYTNTFCLLH